MVIETAPSRHIRISIAYQARFQNKFSVQAIGIARANISKLDSFHRLPGPF